MANINNNLKCYECNWCGDNGSGIYDKEVHMCTCESSPYYGMSKWTEEEMECTCDKMEDIYLKL